MPFVFGKPVNVYRQRRVNAAALKFRRDSQAIDGFLVLQYDGGAGGGNG